MSTEKVVRSEKLGVYPCEVWKRVQGSRITHTWIDDDGMQRLKIYHSTRPAVIEYTTDDRPYVVYCKERIYLDDFLAISTPLKLGKRCFTHATHDTVFSGYYIDVPEDGDSCFVARVLS